MVRAGGPGGSGEHVRLMCFFVNVAVPSHLSDVFTGAMPRGMRADETRNPSLTQHLNGFRAFVVTSGMCSCDLYHRARPDESSRTDQRRKKYEKLGWSESKIQRALQSVEAHARHTARPDFVGLQPDLRQLLAQIVPEVHELVISVHFFSGDVETCRYSLKPGPVLSPDELADGHIPVAEDVLVRVRDKPRQHA